MPTCCVKNRTSRTDHTQTTNLKFFRFPKNAHTWQQWLNACKINDIDIKIDSARVCNLHFNEDYFEMEWTKPRTSNVPTKQRQRLKKDSIPTKMLNLEKRKIVKVVEEKDVANANKKMKVPIPTYTKLVQYMHKNQHITFLKKML
ncbi:uncharacterized protein [Anoplolepis gracilipes]|uniref:uncharacterized protein n=1 Tax=Anoplolepis gracilipes TaxID=354296 RepID=UPI003BA282BA